MDETLKRRVTGAAVLLAGALGLSLLLPQPGGPREPADGARQVIVDLTQPPLTPTSVAPPQESSAGGVTAPPEEPPVVIETALAALSPELSPAPTAAPQPEPTAAPPPIPESTRFKLDSRLSLPNAPPAAPAIKTRVWFVQIGSFSDINNARQAQAKLRAEGALIIPSDTAAGVSYRVRLGPYASKDIATAKRDRLAPQARVVEN